MKYELKFAIDLTNISLIKYEELYPHARRHACPRLPNCRCTNRCQPRSDRRLSLLGRKLHRCPPLSACSRTYHDVRTLMDL